MGSVLRYNTKLKWAEFIKAGVVIPNDATKRRDGLCMCNCGRPAKRVWARPECSAAILSAFLIFKGDGGEIRKAVFKRDRGVCAVCGLDTEKAKEGCRRAFNVGKPWAKERTPEEANRLIGRLEHYMGLGYPSPSEGRTWWEADHILEVVRGGGMCGLDNLQTLCTVCHKAKTRRLAESRAREKKAERSRGQRVLFSGLGQICPKPVIAG